MLHPLQGSDTYQDKINIKWWISRCFVNLQIQHVLSCRTVNPRPTSSNIENWQVRDDRWRHNARHSHDVICAKKILMDSIATNICDDTKRAKKTLLSSQHFTWLVYFPLITIFFILQCHTRVSEKTFDVNSKIAQTTLITWNYRNVQSKRNGKLRRLSWRFQTLIWRLGDTVGSKIWIIRESWQHCGCDRKGIEIL